MTAKLIDLPEVRRVRGELAELARAHPELTTPTSQARLEDLLQEDEVAKQETLSAALYLRVAPDDLAKLDALAERLPVASKNAIARAAMRIGLAEIERDPTVLLASPIPTRGRKKK